MSEIDLDAIKALYESGEGLHDPGQMYAHLLILLAELDWYRTKVETVVTTLDRLRLTHERKGLYQGALAYTGAVELVKRINEREGDLEDEGSGTPEVDHDPLG